MLTIFLHFSVSVLQARKITVDEMQAVVEFFGTKGFSPQAIVGVSYFLLF